MVEGGREGDNGREEKGGKKGRREGGKEGRMEEEDEEGRKRGRVGVGLKKIVERGRVNTLMISPHTSEHITS